MVKKYRKYLVFCTFFSFFLTASKFLNIDFSGQSSNENLNSGFGEKGTAAGKFFLSCFKETKKNQIALFERRRLAKIWIFILTGSRPVKTLFKKGDWREKKLDYNRIYSFTLIPRGQRGDLNLKNDRQKEKG